MPVVARQNKLLKSMYRRYASPSVEGYLQTRDRRIGLRANVTSTGKNSVINHLQSCFR